MRTERNIMVVVMVIIIATVITIVIHKNMFLSASSVCLCTCDEMFWKIVQGRSL